MRKVFLVTSSLVLLSVLAQFYFAGVGAFHRPVDHDGFTLHSANANVLLALVLLNTIAAALARAGGGTIGLAALPFLLVWLQIGIFILTELFIPPGTPRDADGIPTVVAGTPNFVIALHVVNALTILWLAVVVFQRARRLASRPVAAPAASPAATSAAAPCPPGSSLSTCC